MVGEETGFPSDHAAAELPVPEVTVAMVVGASEGVAGAF